jgi:GAF domain-containing protein
MNQQLEITMTREEKVIRAFVELADTLVADFDIIDSLTTLADRCVQVLDAAAVGILLADAAGKLHVVAASSEQARLLELFQLQNDEGPCLEAFETGHLVIHTDLRAAIEQWPKFTPYAVGAGYDSVYAIPLRLRGEVIGALNLFRSNTGALADNDIALAQALADHASITILQAQAATEARHRDQQLQYALDSRVVIEQAKGMVAERAHIDMASAFDCIRTRSRDTNTKLTEVATQIVNGHVDIAALTTKAT